MVGFSRNNRLVSRKAVRSESEGVNFPAFGSESRFPGAETGPVQANRLISWWPSEPKPLSSWPSEPISWWLSCRHPEPELTARAARSAPGRHKLRHRQPAHHGGSVLGSCPDVSTPTAPSVTQPKPVLRCPPRRPSATESAESQK